MFPIKYRVNNVYVICGFAAIGGGLFGFDISSMSGIIGTQAYKSYFDNPKSYTQGAITASMPAGSLVGSLCSSFLADRYSRKVAMQTSCLLWIFGSALQSGALNIAMLCAGRAIAGLGVGISSTVVPVYQAEIAPRDIRGRVVSLQQCAITWGILIQYFVQYAAAQSIGNGPEDPDQPPIAFRIPWAVQITPALIMLAGVSSFPHSPRWLATQNRWADMFEVLADLHGGGDKRHPLVLAEYRDIEETLRMERREGITSMRNLFQRRLLKRLMLGMSVQAWSQLCGMNIMMYYIVYIMQGSQMASPLLTASIQYIINVVFTVPAIMYLDRWGRRPSLVVGSFCMMALFFISGAVQQYFGRPNTEDTRTPGNRDISWLVEGNRGAAVAVVACSYMFVATFATTWGPTSWTYPAEIFPGSIRTRAVSLSTATNWCANMVLAFTVPPLLWKINYQTYYIFGALNCIAFVHMFFAAHETRGFTLEEMDDVFDAGEPAWRKVSRPSRITALERNIANGTITVETPFSGSRRESFECTTKVDGFGGVATHITTIDQTL
ncbi:MFS sugar transporter-like protein [Stachybotrys elegans]|uniref:MFS sugar transporter-like protein n=1 Tax=Stachybotrys elegans TaxID=80388 RepID=A0A8K0WNN9_9HYPO|nr:MFS sugar transporter-like protein [Stachybotrys elegans]